MTPRRYRPVIWTSSAWWECSCGRWAASEEVANREVAAWDFAREPPAFCARCGYGLVRLVTRHKRVWVR